METSVRLYSLNYKEARTYLFAALFIIGNILFPQLCHLIPKGGLILLPIYFFTLIGAYKYGFLVGLLTAVLSPILNHLLFGMPPTPTLLPILVKSITLAAIAAYVARRAGKVTLLTMLFVVLGYQFIGSIIEGLMANSVSAALQDIRLGIPGLLIQIFGGYLFIKYILHK